MNAFMKKMHKQDEPTEADPKGKKLGDKKSFIDKPDAVVSDSKDKKHIEKKPQVAKKPNMKEVQPSPS